MNNSGNSGKNIVVLGAGYGGMTAALRLATLFRHSSEYRIHLVDKNPFHTLKTQLHEAAVHNREVTIDIGRIIRHRRMGFHLGTVTSIDPSRRVLTIGETKLSFDFLLIALGSQANYYDIPGLETFAMPLQTAADAEKIYKHISALVAKASTERDTSLKKGMLRFVIGGGGLSGIEFAAELSDYVRTSLDNYAIAHAQAEITVIEASDKILPSVDKSLRNRVTQKLFEKGVTILTRNPVVALTSGSVSLASGVVLTTSTFVWTGGIRIADTAGNSGFKIGRTGRIVVDRYLRSVDYPAIYAIGDNAEAINPKTGEPVPAAAQFALQQGRKVAENIYASVRGTEPSIYSPRVWGEVVSLGRHLAAGWMALPIVKRIEFIGFLASLVKSATKGKHILLLRKESRNWISY
jgi:NADH dehydrogenase